MPGNHDWYDGLSAFTRLFCSDIGGRRLAGWWTRQRRSYFVLKLPHRWWLVASDGQLQSDLDVPQMEHFREIADRHMQPGDKVILCLSQPVWVYAQKYRNMGRVFDETDLIYLREEVFAKRGIDVKVYLTGDLHHYRRHEETRESAGAAEPVQKITAGGGGAFLHPDARRRLLAPARGGHHRRRPAPHLRGPGHLSVHRAVGAPGVGQSAASCSRTRASASCRRPST